MANSRVGPYLVREEAPVEPGAHSHNRVRRTQPVPKKGGGSGSLRALRVTLFLLGVAGTGYYAYSLGDEYIYQSFQNWSFDQQIAGRKSASFGDYLRERTVFGPLTGQPTAAPTQLREMPADAPRPAHGSLLGRISIERLGISAIVREGTDAATLSRAVGHVPSTSLAGQAGNCSIAAHRDTLFRALKNIHLGDIVQFQTATATYSYRVIASQIVRPSDVSVLRADGGPRLLQQISWRPSRLLTMITCYPFNYIGSAPERFIVQAEAVTDSAPATRKAEGTAPASHGARRPGLVASRRTTTIAQAISPQQPQTRQPVQRKHF